MHDLVVEIGRTKFSLKAYISENVIWLWWYARYTGSRET